MSFQYDQYLARHRANVKRGFDWLSKNLPGLMTNTLTAGWNTEFAHDQSKNEPDEYEAYDAYFYGNNRSYEVVQRYQRAWLLHIHRNQRGVYVYRKNRGTLQYAYTNRHYNRF